MEHPIWMIHIHISISEKRASGFGDPIKRTFDGQKRSVHMCTLNNQIFSRDFNNK